MPLVLTYRGPLPAVNDRNKRNTEKQIIRRSLHEQIVNGPKKRYMMLAEHSELWRPRKIRNFSFHALICKNPFFPRRGCDLEIKILSNDPFGALYQKGDLDNRLKTLFDALCLPNKDQLPANDYPKERESPLWVLLADDSLITDLHIIQNSLHLPVEQKNYVELTISVSIKDEYRV